MAHTLQHGYPMPLRWITCPETAHLELIECEDTPFGMLIAGCSRFRPACLVECARTCTALLDRRARAEGSLEPVEDDTDHDLEMPIVLEVQSLLRSN